MKAFLKLSVKSKITLIIIGVSMVTVGLTMVFLIISQHVSLKREITSSVTKDAHIIGEYFIMPMTFGSHDRGQEILLNVMNNPNIVCLNVLTHDKKEFVSHCKQGININDYDILDKTHLKFTGNYLIINEPIIRDSAVHGNLNMLYYTGIKDGTRTKIIISLLIFVVIITVSYLLARYFQKYISDPILSLANTASNISKTQDYNIVIEKSSNDEIGILIDSLNKMLSAIMQREAERDEITAAYVSNVEKLRNIFNSGLDGILLTDMDGYIKEVSNMACSILGYRTESLLNKRLARFMPPEYEKQRVSILKELEKNNATTFNTKYYKRDGTEIYLEFSSRLIKIDDNKRCLSYLRDITEKLQAEDALKESEERYKKLVEHFPSAIVLHRKNEIIFVNEAIKSILKSNSKKEFHGRNICNFIHKDYVEQINKQFSYAIKEDKVSAAEEILMERVDGSPVNVEIITIPLSFSRRKTLLSVFNDISSRKQIENELILAKNKAEESDKLKSAFLANMSHEIRTPMNGIIGFADLLAKDNIQPGEIKRYVDIIRTSADRLLNIINDIIDISKIESGAINIVKDDFILNHLLVELHQFFMHSAKTKGLELELNISATEDIVVHSDRNKINQIITNLISNSIKFTSEGYVKISCIADKEKNWVNIYVKDTGVGIPKEQQKEIFERFRQAKNYIHDFTEGTGLGLSISKGFSDALGGKIYLESDENSGAEFCLSIPYSRLSESNTNTPAGNNTSSKSIINLSNKTILLAEDEEVNYQYLHDLLSPTGVDLHWVRNGLQAVQKVIEQPKYDLILMDIKLPVMNGLTAAKRIKSINNKIPIIAQTAFGLEEDKEEITNGDCDDYLSKPISEKQFFEVLKKYLSA